MTQNQQTSVSNDSPSNPLLALVDNYPGFKGCTDPKCAKPKVPANTMWVVGLKGPLRDATIEDILEHLLCSTDAASLKQVGQARPFKLLDTLIKWSAIREGRHQPPRLAQEEAREQHETRMARQRELIVAEQQRVAEAAAKRAAEEEAFKARRLSESVALAAKRAVEQTAKEKAKREMRRRRDDFACAYAANRLPIGTALDIVVVDLGGKKLACGLPRSIGCCDRKVEAYAFINTASGVAGVCQDGYWGLHVRGYMMCPHGDLREQARSRCFKTVDEAAKAAFIPAPQPKPVKEVPTVVVAIPPNTSTPWIPRKALSAEEKTKRAAARKAHVRWMSQQDYTRRSGKKSGGSNDNNEGKKKR